MNRILIVGDYNRSDFLYPAKLFNKEVEFYFIEHLNKKYIESTEVFQYGKVIFWKDFSDAYDLLEKIAPSCIIFYFLEAYNHVALNVAARMRDIPTYHLEHGVRFFVEGLKSDHEASSSFLKKISKKQLSFSSEAFDRFKTRRFYTNTLKKSENKARECLVQFFKVRSTHNILDTFKKVKNDLRLPAQYISFSPLIFEHHKSVERLPDQYPVHFIGIPAFDHFAQWKALNPVGNAVLFIDQPLHEQKLLGWTAIRKKEFLSQLLILINSIGRKLFIKPHPWNNNILYQDILVNENVVLVGNQWDNAIKQIDTVVGFSSTLLMPFMAMRQICCFTMEMHPQMSTKPYSYFFLNSEACHAVHSFEELKESLVNSGIWRQRQMLAKDRFIDKYMFFFDGKCSERLINVINPKKI